VARASDRALTKRVAAKIVVIQSAAVAATRHPEVVPDRTFRATARRLSDRPHWFHTGNVTKVEASPVSDD
jgi:hypothetical protein